MSIKKGLHQYFSTIWAKEYSQVDENDCGICCIAYLLRRSFGLKISLEQFKNTVNYQGQALSIGNLIGIATTIGINFSPYQGDTPIDLDYIKLPAILHLKNNHYIVLYSRINNTTFDIFDPSKGACLLKKCDIESEASGYFIEMDESTKSISIQESSKFSIHKIYDNFNKHKSKLVLLMLISLISQIISLSPIVVTQVIVDAVVNSEPNEKIFFLMGVCVLILLLDMLVTHIRGGVLNKLKINLSIDSAQKAFRNLWVIPEIKLSQKTSSRLLKDFYSIHTIREIICGELISFALNISICIISIAMLFYYHSWAALISLLGASLYVLIKVLFIPHFIYLESEQHISKSSFDGYFYETADQISSIKSNPLFENRKYRLWKNYLGALHNEAKSYNFSLNFTTISIAVFGFVSLLSTAICFSSVISSEISIGFAFGFIAIQQKFITASSQCIDNIHTVSMYRICFDRLHIFSSIGSKNCNQWLKNESLLNEFEISLRNYRTIKNKHVNITILPGDLIIVTGESGSGKSNMLKKIFIDEFNSPTIVKCERQEKNPPKVCLISQNDRLFSGTLEDNITFFSNVINQEHLTKCIDICGIKDLIISLRYGIQTPISPNNAPFSGGQYQRVLLARAIYAKPDILIIDEATSDLDIKNEIILIQKIKEHVKTIIIVSHKPEIHKLGNKIINID
jgi:ATP-binding cassette subfamily B protein RaxB